MSVYTILWGKLKRFSFGNFFGKNEEKEEEKNGEKKDISQILQLPDFVPSEVSITFHNGFYQSR